MNLHVVEAQKQFLNECLMLRFSEFIIKLLLKSQNLNHLPFLPLLVSFIGLPSLLLQHLLTPECILINKSVMVLATMELGFCEGNLQSRNYSLSTSLWCLCLVLGIQGFSTPSYQINLFLKKYVDTFYLSRVNISFIQNIQVQKVKT